ncbi:hypothetical protein [uncultured Mycolicibacterium sp.]|uniref:hypothetical protein n=1 Tax=uncultured Mycolicibacterium sp. TaxID=2320817 RepID=UPI00261366A1|nr:hypothetical protein [uncultured Mycolicibacterium sp.]
MEFVYNLVVVAHFLGLAALIGGYLAGRPAVNTVMLWGARVQLLTGVILVGMGDAIDSLDKEFDWAKIGLKLAITVVVVALTEVGRARTKRNEVLPALAHAAGALGVVNVFIAVLWH